MKYLVKPLFNYWPRSTKKWKIPRRLSLHLCRSALALRGWFTVCPAGSAQLWAKTHSTRVRANRWALSQSELFLLTLADFRTHLFIFPSTSWSFMKHSMLSGRSILLELISFFNFSHSWYRRRRARILDFASNLYLVLNSAQKCSTNFSSKFFPPKKGSKAVPST